MQLNLKKSHKPHMSKNHTKIIKHRLHNNFPYERVITQTECGYYFFFFYFQVRIFVCFKTKWITFVWGLKKINIRENIFLPKGNVPAIEWMHNKKNLRLCSSRFEVESTKTSSLDCITWKKAKTFGEKLGGSVSTHLSRLNRKYSGHSTNTELW